MWKFYVSVSWIPGEVYMTQWLVRILAVLSEGLGLSPSIYGISNQLQFLFQALTWCTYMHTKYSYT